MLPTIQEGDGGFKVLRKKIAEARNSLTGSE
jgi:hypothetical protein